MANAANLKRDKGTHLFHLFLCKSEMNAGQFSNHHGSLIIVSNHVPWNYFLEN